MTRWPLVFANIGHGYMHLLVALYLTIVLSVEDAWNLTYAELIGLWTPGAVMLGLMAPAAGWIGDRWSRAGMMVVFFVGSGAAVIGAGLAQNSWQLMGALTALGAFAAIFHPVGMAWLVQNSRRHGFALGIFGFAGSIGVAGAGVTAGALADFADWRMAFIVPGGVSILLGLILWAGLAKGRVSRSHDDVAPQSRASRGDMVRVFVLLSLTVFLGGLIYQGTQVAMPKLFETRLGASEFEAGLLFTAVYLSAGGLQIWFGHLADRFSYRRVYLLTYLVQVPLLFFAAGALGVPLVATVIAMVMFNVGGLPAENALMARYAPSGGRGTAFGLKFVLSLGVTPVAVALVSWIHARTGDFEMLYLVLGSAAAIIVLAALMLPKLAEADAVPAAAE